MFLVTLVVFILVLGVLVVVHEWGHYITARKVGIKVEEFAIGMGPKIWGIKRKTKDTGDEIEYNIRAFPIGGFVRMYGEGDYDVIAPNSFAGKKPSKRLIVLLAGVFMNFILAVILFYAQGVHQDFKYRTIEGILPGEFQPAFGQKTEPKIAIRKVSDTSPLKGKVGDFDIITKVNGQDYKSEEFSQFIKENRGKEITLDLVEYTSDTKKTVKVTPRTEEQTPKEEGSLGISILEISFIEFNGSSKLLAGFGQSFNTIKQFAWGIKGLVAQSIEKNTIVPVADNVGGAIGLFDALQSIILIFGFWGVLELAALFSINLAVFNVLPIPALDGGHVLFTTLELITRRRLPTKIYNYLTLGGFMLLMSFMLVITALDLVKTTNLRNLFCNETRQVRFICDLSDYR